MMNTNSIRGKIKEVKKLLEEIESEINKKDIPSIFSVGDKVTVIDSGKKYSTLHPDMVCFHNNNFYALYKNTVQNVETQGIHGIVMRITYYEDVSFVDNQSYYLITIIDKSGNCYIYNERGLEVIK